MGEEIVATGRVIELAEGYWWLEGLRVSPRHQGRGYATHFHNHLVEVARQQPGIRTLALATSWENEKVAHLARQSGMTLRGDYRLFKAPALPEPEPNVTPYLAVPPSDLLARVQGCRWLARSDGHAMDGWVARPLDEAWLAEIIGAGGVWRCGDALALLGRGSHHDQSWLYLFEGGSEAEQAALVRHARHVTHRLTPRGQLRCFAPVDEALVRPLLAAGMGDPWGGDEGEFHVFHFAMDVGNG